MKDKERIETLKLHLAEERERIQLVQKLDIRAKGGDPENLRQAVQGKMLIFAKYGVLRALTSIHSLTMAGSQ